VFSFLAQAKLGWIIPTVSGDDPERGGIQSKNLARCLALFCIFLSSLKQSLAGLSRQLVGMILKGVGFNQKTSLIASLCFVFFFPRSSKAWLGQKKQNLRLLPEVF